MKVMEGAAPGNYLQYLEIEALQRVSDFRDPRQQWQRVFAELIGTFFLVLVAAGGDMMRQAFPGTVARSAAVVAPGVMVMAMIMSMGRVSGAHFNPAVSVAFALRGDFPWSRVPGYVVAQFVGAFAAAGYWVYLAGPLLGAVMAVGAGFLLRGQGGGRGGAQAAQGMLLTVVKHPDIPWGQAPPTDDAQAIGSGPSDGASG